MLFLTDRGDYKIIISGAACFYLLFIFMIVHIRVVMPYYAMLRIILGSVVLLVLSGYPLYNVVFSDECVQKLCDCSGPKISCRLSARKLSACILIWID